ncbi:amylo-alpha-1,6-glucosidase [Granulicella sp. L60]|uniref:amylo-alpha-1,6-glucosidase n=1 Tax=Granulicella sp. L60 TaxID=1641866 RepID=UPI00131D803C|nr:glycogen debranching protein [Granulicella sp. L60]
MTRLAALLLFLCSTAGLSQTSIAPLSALPAFPTKASDLPLISREAVPTKPFSVLGPRGALLGQQDGSFEAWLFPWKIFSGMKITANMQDYAVPIDVNDHAAWIDVQPDATTITYSHANFTIRQIMIAPKESADQAGVLVFFQIESIRPMTLTFSLHPVMQRMWPAASDDVPSPEWVATGKESGYYVLHLNLPDNAAALAMPGAQSGILAPYQERASSWPLQFVLHYDPAKDGNKLFPLLMSFGSTEQTANKAALGDALTSLNQSAQSLFTKNEAYYRNLLATHTSIDTPDQKLNEAFTWAVAAIDQLRVKTTPDLKEEALTAGFVGSGDAARPGFGWFFGRDALWSLYAVNSYGDTSTFKSEIEFLLRRQGADGRMIHEWSQTADLVDWKSLPYEYASSDATPLLQMIVKDYFDITGDKDFVTSHWSQLELAWKYETSHDSSDGIYNNTVGSGWVESWIPSMPHQEIYLATLDAQASAAFANLARISGHDDLAAQADQRAQHLRQVIEQEYYLPQTSFYAFSHNEDGTTDNTPTIFPSVAWWDGTYKLKHAEPMLQQWASSEFSTDWGTRILSDKVSFYDPISYHQGSVWPLFTGWVSVAEYRAGHSLSAYAHLMQNADLTWSQDLGATTELLSGRFYQVLGRSTAHQLWSSAMVISPIMRGMFGVEWDVPHHTLTVTPHLPADWNTATIHHVPFGDSQLDLTFSREGQSLVVRATGPAATGLHLVSHIDGAKEDHGMLRLPLKPIEVYTGHELPSFGSETHQMKVLKEQYDDRSITLLLAAPALSAQSMSIRVNESRLRPHAENAELSTVFDGRSKLNVAFPAASGDVDGYVQKTVTIRW